MKHILKILGQHLSEPHFKYWLARNHKRITDKPKPSSLAFARSLVAPEPYTSHNATTAHQEPCLYSRTQPLALHLKTPNIRLSDKPTAISKSGCLNDKYKNPLDYPKRLYIVTKLFFLWVCPMVLGV